MKIERTKNTIRNMAWGTISKICSILLPFILRTVMIYMLGAEYLGLNSLFTSVLQALSLSELGFGAAMVYSMYKPIAENDTTKIDALLNLYRKVYKVIGTIIFGIGLLITPFIPRLITGSYPQEINIYVVYIAFILNTVISYFLAAYRTALFSAFQREDLTSKITTVISILKNGIQCAVVILTKDYYYFLVVLIVMAVLNNILNYVVSKKLFPEYKPQGKVDRDELAAIKKNVVALMCHKIGGTILNSADNIVISAFLGLTILTQYNNYYYIMSSADSVVIIFFTGMTAGIGNSFITESLEKNRANFKKILFFNAVVSAWFSSILACVLQDFIKLWVGEEFMFSNGLMVLIVIYFFIHSIRRTIIAFRDATGLWWDNRWQPIVSAMFNLVVNIILVQFIGVYGIVISTILSMILIDIPWEARAFCWNKLEVSPSLYFKDLIKYAAVTIVAAGVPMFLVSFLHFNLIINLIIELFIATGFTASVIIAVFGRTDEFSYFKGLVKNLIKG